MHTTDSSSPSAGATTINPEHALLSALMQDVSCLDKLAEMGLVESMFQMPLERKIYRVIVDLGAAGLQAGMVDVLMAMQTASQTKDDIQAMVDISHIAPSAANVVRYAQAVIEAAARRAMIEAGRRIQDLASGQADLAQAMEEAYKTLSSVTLSRREHVAEKIEAIASRRLDAVQDAIAGKKPVRWSTGFHEIDRKLNGGLSPGRVYVVAARPSIGKSSLCGSMAGNLARSGVPTCFFSQEMPSDELGDRFIANFGPTDYSLLQRLEEDELVRGDTMDGIMAGYLAAQDIPLWIDDQTGLTREDLRRKLAFARQQGVRVAFVDYLQLCGLPGKQNRTVEIGDISIAMKNTAKELDMAIVLLSQLNRAVEGRASPKPTLADLRDSGQVFIDIRDAHTEWRRL